MWADSWAGVMEPHLPTPCIDAQRGGHPSDPQHPPMSNTVANRRYVEQLEADMKKLKQEKTAAEAM